MVDRKLKQYATQTTWLQLSVRLIVLPIQIAFNCVIECFLQADSLVVPPAVCIVSQTVNCLHFAARQNIGPGSLSRLVTVTRGWEMWYTEHVERTARYGG